MDIYRYTGAKKWASSRSLQRGMSPTPATIVSSTSSPSTKWHFYDNQRSYDITLHDVKCTRGEWGSCTFSYTGYCKHSEDVFLSCQGKLLCCEQL
jgi:hypothetical protein